METFIATTAMKRWRNDLQLYPSEVKSSFGSRFALMQYYIIKSNTPVCVLLNIAFLIKTHQYGQHCLCRFMDPIALRDACVICSNYIEAKILLRADSVLFVFLTFVTPTYRSFKHYSIHEHKRLRTLWRKTRSLSVYQYIIISVGMNHALVTPSSEQVSVKQLIIWCTIIRLRNGFQSRICTHVIKSCNSITASLHCLLLINLRIFKTKSYVVRYRFWVSERYQAFIRSSVQYTCNYYLNTPSSSFEIT